jgi:glycosyltransferase involved in cell wall biosynthesis
MTGSIISESLVRDFRTGKSFNDLPLVTIGVLSYNYSQYIEAALNSLLTQTYPFIELIIVDDCSTELSVPETIKNWIADNNIHCTFIQNKKNLGITKVSNILVKKAKGKYLSLFATDDIMLPKKIERQVKILEEAGEEYGMCYANVETMNEAGERTGLYNPDMNTFEGNVLYSYVSGNLPFATPSCLIRKSVYNRTGLYDERVLIEDYNFWLRLMACYKVKYCDYPCLVYRIKNYWGVHDELMKNNRERYYRDRILSNQQALKFVQDKKVKLHLKLKIEQYLKTLAVHNSHSFKHTLLFLLRNGYLYLSFRLFWFKQFSNFRKRLHVVNDFIQSQ